MQRRSTRGLLALLSVMLALVGCATPTPAPPSAPDKDGGAIGIEVLIRPVLGSPYRAQFVYFARLGEGLELLDVRLSSFYKDGRVYLLNAPPGRYQPVAAGFSAGFIGPENKYLTYLPQGMLDAAVAAAVPGRLAYAGSYAVNLQLGVCPNNADLAQQRYAEIVAPGVPKCGLSNIVLHQLATNTTIIGGQAVQSGAATYHYSSTLADSRRDAAAERAFREQAQLDLQGAGWSTEP